MASSNDFDIPVEVAGIRFRNPFYVASGPTTMKIEQLKRIEETGWGGASLKLTLDPPPYINRRPRYGYYEMEQALTFTAEKRLTLEELLKLIDAGRKETSEIVLFSNITYAGEKGIEGWVEMAKKCENAGAHINELNMCCPNMSFNVEMSGEDTGGPKTGASLGQNRDAIVQLVKAIKEETSIPLFVKITPEGGGQAEIAKAALEAGADAVGSNANRLAVPPVNLDRPTKSMYHLQEEIGMACMNSRWLLPLGKRDVYMIRRLVGPDHTLTATGGVTFWRDAVEMAMCGADLVGMCASTLVYGYGFMPEFIQGVKQYMKEKGYKNFSDMRDILVPALTSAPDLTIYEGHAQKKDENLSAPCRNACPMQLPIQGILARVAQRKFKEAYDLIQSCGPLQEVCSRICDHPCEAECIRGQKDAPLNIMGVKRFVMDYAAEKGWEPEIEKEPSNGMKAAVVGAGPAGLSAAFHLARAGYGVTVFEKESKAGGTIKKYIPGFRMDITYLDKEIEKIRQLGVKFTFDTAVGSDVSLESLRGSHDAVFIGSGAQKGIIPEIKGVSLKGCTTGIDFICGHPDVEGKTVVVVGGGFTAVDAARTAVRGKAREVFILYRRNREEMPASREEIAEAEDEGVRIVLLASPIEILGKEHVEGIRAAVNTLGDEDDSGRRRPDPLEGSEFSLDADMVVFAVSQMPVSRDLGIDTDGREYIAADTETGETSMEGVFAGGDCVTGPQNIISAVRAGYEAACSIDMRLRGDEAVLEPNPELAVVDVEDVLVRKGGEKRSDRLNTGLRPAETRISDSKDTVVTFTEDEAVAEASRCMGCGCGAGCEVCSDICTVFAWSVEGGRTVLEEEKCVGCGMCIWRCPNNNIEMIQTSDEPV